MARLAHHLKRVRCSLLTVGVSAFVIGLAGWGLASVIAVIVLRTMGGLCS